MAEGQFELYYWPGMPGRGEFARLVFEETETPYRDVFRGRPWEEVKATAYDAARQDGRYAFYMPYVKNGEILVFNSQAIVTYLARTLQGGRLLPETEQQRVWAESLMGCIVDAVAEGHDAWHPINHHGSHESQREQAQPFMQQFQEQRLPRWLSYFEDMLVANAKDFPGTEGSGPWLVGPKMSYLDLCMFQWLDAIQFQCEGAYQKAQGPHLKALQERVADTPNIKRYLQSGRRESYTNTGPMF